SPAWSQGVAGVLLQAVVTSTAVRGVHALEVRLPIRSPANGRGVRGRLRPHGLLRIEGGQRAGGDRGGGGPRLWIPGGRLADERATGFLGFGLALVLQNPVHRLVLMERHA